MWIIGEYASNKYDVRYDNSYVIKFHEVIDVKKTRIITSCYEYIRNHIILRALINNIMIS